MVTPPRLVTEYAVEYVAAATRHLLREREAGYPRAVEAGRMTEDAAAHGLIVMRAVAAQWAWVIGDAPLPEWSAETLGHFGAAEPMLADEMKTAAARAHDRAAAAPGDPERREWAAIFDALTYWQQLAPLMPRAINVGLGRRQCLAFHASLRQPLRRAA